MRIVRTSKSKEPFKLISKNGNKVTYTASFWNGDKQRYDIIEVTDLVINGKMANTAPNVSYYSQLKGR